MFQLPNIGGNVTRFSLVCARFFWNLAVALTTYYYVLIAERCNERGEFLASDAPPVLPEVWSTTDWFPFNSRVNFKLADFIFADAELSRKKTNRLLELWTATLIPHGAAPHIGDHADLLRQIDSIPLGNVPWECASLSYEGPLSESNPPPEWMTTEYNVWFRNPREVIKGILANPEFDGHVDYSAYREFENFQRRYRDMMSGDWAWRQLVSKITNQCVIVTNTHAGRDFSKSFDMWLDVRANHSWIRQDDGFRCDRPERILPALPFNRQYPEPYEEGA